MNDKKGQALVEFILILPVFLYLILVIIDFSHIFYVKNDITNLMDGVVDMYEKRNDINKIETFIQKENKHNKIDIQKDGDIVLKLYREIDFISPGLGYFFDTPYKVEVRRVISSE